MGKKKEQATFDQLVTRATKLIAKKNHAAALVALEQAACMEKREELAEKIALCKKEANNLKAKNLTKRARGHEKKGRLQQALDSYEQAQRLCPEQWIGRKLEQLGQRLREQNTRATAEKAEAAGDYQAAAALYAQMTDSQEVGDDLLAKQARCLVQSKRFEEALQLFDDLPEVTANYDRGLALANTGRYYDCLKSWEPLTCQQSTFVAQREAVQSRLAEDLFCRLAEGRAFDKIYQEGLYLQRVCGRQDLQLLIEHSCVGQIEELWREERFSTIAELLPSISPCPGSALISLYAKTYFKLAEMTGTHLSKMALYWLTAVYSETRSEDAERSEIQSVVRQRLIERAAELIKQLADNGDEQARQELICWQVERKLIKDLDRLVGQRSELFHLVTTPRCAAQLGRSTDVVELIRDSRGFFQDEEHYLRIGSYYSAAGQSLLFLDAGDHDQAMASLPRTNQPDPFLRYGIKRVQFAYGMLCLQLGRGRPGRFLDAGVDPFDISQVNEAELIRRALQVTEPDELQRYEEALGLVYKKKPTRPLAQALSLVISRRAIAVFNRNRIKVTVLKRTLDRALQIDPQNDLAQSTLQSIRPDLDLQALSQALNRNKMGKACRIAAASPFQEVKEHFFNYLDGCIDEVEDMADDLPKQLHMLEKLSGLCCEVNAAHPLVAELAEMIDDLREEVEQ